VLICGVRGAHTADVADLGSPKARTVAFAERLTSGAVDIWDANSPGGAEFIRRLGVPQDRIRYIPNGLDVRLWPLRPAQLTLDPPQVICVSRFVACKRHVDLMRAISLLRGAGGEYTVHLVGDGPTRPEVHRLTRRLGIQQRVQFHGALDHHGIHELMHQCSLFCLPSTWEGMPGAVMEAMASGLAVVGTDVNGINTLVLDGVTGRLVPPRAPQRLAAVLGECVQDPQLMLQLGREGRRRIEREFSIDEMVKRKEELYAEAAALTR
jgi:glycosyltransferase involved in cell wall biosynthesis